MNKTMILCSTCKDVPGDMLAGKCLIKGGGVTRYVRCNDCNNKSCRSYYKRHSEQARKTIYRSIKKHSHKQHARVELNKAVSRGDVLKPDECPKCSTSEYRLEAHHTDYSKPLEIDWLCSRCHGAADREHRKLVL